MKKQPTRTKSGPKHKPLAVAAEPAPAPPQAPAAPSRFSRPSFRIAGGLFSLGPLFILLSQTLPHDYGFLELGELYTLSIYDVVLGMLGLSVACARIASLPAFAIVVAVFLAVCLPPLVFFDPFFQTLQALDLTDDLFLVTPMTIILSGLCLWLPQHRLFQGALVVSALLGLCLTLFIGLDDLGVGVPSFAIGSVISALWLIVAPGLVLREFNGPWLRIPSRIVGSWLSVIGLIVLASLYLPKKDDTSGPAVPPVSGDTEPQTGN